MWTNKNLKQNCITNKDFQKLNDAIIKILEFQKQHIKDNVMATMLLEGICDDLRGLISMLN